MIVLIYIRVYYIDTSVERTGKWTTCKIHTKLHPGTEWRIFYIPTSEDIDGVISRFFSVVYANNQFV